MSDEIEPEGEEALTPPPARKPRKKEPMTVQIRSGGPIAPGRVDFEPQRRSGPDPRSLVIVAIGVVVVVVLIVVALSR